MGSTTSDIGLSFETLEGAFKNIEIAAELAKHSSTGSPIELDGRLKGHHA